MEEVIGSIPIRSTTLTSAESKSYSNGCEEQNPPPGELFGNTERPMSRSPYLASMGRGAFGETRLCFRNSCQNSPGTTVSSAAWSSTIRSGLLAPRMMAADVGCASGARHLLTGPIGRARSFSCLSPVSATAGTHATAFRRVFLLKRLRRVAAYENLVAGGFPISTIHRKKPIWTRLELTTTPLAPLTCTVQRPGNSDHRSVLDLLR